MLNPIELKFKVDKDSKSAFRTKKIIKSHDINSVEFHISFDGLELTDEHIVKVLTSFHSSQSQTNVECEIVGGKAIYRPDTSLISQYEQVTSYVYVYLGDQSLDVREFTYSVDLSKIDETALKVKEVYDQSYAVLLGDFEQALQNYKDTLPQADSVRAEIDVILNQFGVDSQAKLNQYDADAQQVIADNQTAFGLAESGRQSKYEQAEDIRNQASSQALADWEQGADGLVDSKLIEIQTDANTLINGAIDDFNVRGDAEIADWREGADADLVRLDSEKANRKQEDWITPTLINSWQELGGPYPVRYHKDEFGFVHLSGMLKSGALRTTAFILPAGYRPPVEKYMPVATFNQYGQVTVLPSGSVMPVMGSTTWFSLNGISFRAVN